MNSVYQDIFIATLQAVINRIYHQSPMQTQKFQPEGKWIMPETSFTKLPALLGDLKVEI